jgi:hypothetical protein
LGFLGWKISASEARLNPETPNTAIDVFAELLQNLKLQRQSEKS